MKTQITIHRALAELKLIDARISKAISIIEPTCLIQNEKLVRRFETKSDFEKSTKEKYQSVIGLIQRKVDIKSAIVKANGSTEVKVGEKAMTIADAINFKSVIEMKKNLISQLTHKHNTVKTDFIQGNEKINDVALENAKIMIGKQGDDRVKATDTDIKNIVEPFIKRNEFHLVDPLSIEKLIETMQNEVDEFETEVDSVLSEINATTFIEI